LPHERDCILRADRRPELQAELRALDDKIAAADRALKVAEDLHDGTTGSLYFRRQQVNAAISEANRAGHELVETCNEPCLRHEKAELDAAITDAGERLNALHERARHMDNQAHTECENAKSEPWPTEGERRLEIVQKYQANADAARRSIKEAEREMATLEKRRDELKERMWQF
jgi:predicted  nucleic acid-binding Zn-ribbon protein